MTLSSTEFRHVCGCFATGVAVLTTVAPDGEPHGMTINSFVSLSLDPPLVMAAIAHSSLQLAAFDAAGSFAINILTEEQKDISRLFAKPSDDRFRNIDWEPGETGSPLLADSLAVLECRITRRLDTGDHRLIIGEAVASRVEKGKPLLYFRSGYHSLDD